MSILRLPETYKYIEVYLTFRCTQSCVYCMNRIGTFKHRGADVELTGSQWIDALNRLDLARWTLPQVPLPVTLGGGEPTLHPNFYDILTGLRRDIKVDLLTNLDCDVTDFAKFAPVDRFYRGNLAGYKSIRVSYHPKDVDAGVLVAKVAYLQSRGYAIGIFGLNHPEHLQANAEMGEVARQSQVYFFIKDYLGVYDGQVFGHYAYANSVFSPRQACECATTEFLVGPDGLVYRCHRDLYAGENEIGSILDNEFVIEHVFRPCQNYGNCNPCDTKSKLNRFLQMGQCSVRIKNIAAKPTEQR